VNLIPHSFILSWHFSNSFNFQPAKLRKKVVIGNGFWKINAIRPKIKARWGKTGKFKFGLKANWGGLVKELGFQIVTSFSHLLHLCDDAFEARQ
jgi:hypothetical protein